jgi:hypothetical protein
MLNSFGEFAFGARLPVLFVSSCGGWPWIDDGAALEFFELAFVPQGKLAAMDRLRDATVLGHPINRALVHLVALRYLRFSEKLFRHVCLRLLRQIKTRAER